MDSSERKYTAHVILGTMIAVLVIGYALSIMVDIRAGYKSGDERGFLTAFTDRTASPNFDIRYMLWLWYVGTLSAIHNQLVPLINAFLVVLLLYIGSLKSRISQAEFLILLLLPSVFYFLNTYLRDVAYLIYSLYILAAVDEKTRFRSWSFLLLLVFWAALVTMRPQYGLLYLLAFVVSVGPLRKLFPAIVLVLLTVFVTTALVIAFNETAYEMYRNFFVLGHLRGKSEVGALLIPIGQFDQVNASLNFLISPLYFWFVPATGFGRVYDYLLFFESLTLFGVLALAIFRFHLSRIYYDWAYRFSVAMIVQSLFVAASTTVLDDAYRFRLIFLPFTCTSHFL